MKFSELAKNAKRQNTISDERKALLDAHSRTSMKPARVRKAEQTSQQNAVVAEEKPFTALRESTAEETARRKEFARFDRLIGDKLRDEKIEYVYRRHWVELFYIAARFVPGWVLSVISLIFLLLAVLVLKELIVFAIIFMVLVVGGSLLWIVNDHQNDYLIVTNMRVIQIDKVSFFRSDRNELLVERVQEVQIDSSRNALEWSFRIGTVTVTGIGKNNITFNRIPHPETVRKQIDSLVKAYRGSRLDLRRQRMENYLENKFMGVPLKNWAGDRRTQHAVAKEDSIWNVLFPRHPVLDEPDKPNGRISWYKHPWILVRENWFFLVLAIALLIGTVFFGLVGIIASVAIPFVAPILLILYFFLWGYLLFRMWYRYENWRNDRYVVEFEEVLNIDKKPFGFDKTSSVIKIRNIQDIKVNQSGLMANLLNFGTVTVTAAGSDSKVVFQSVPYPQEVEDEIARRQEIWKYLEEDRQDKLQADFLAQYDKILRQRREYQ